MTTTKMMRGGMRSGRLRQRIDQFVSGRRPPHSGLATQPMTTVSAKSEARMRPGIIPAR